MRCGRVAGCGCTDDARLFARMARGDDEARERLLRRHHRLVKALAHRFSVPDAEREDLVQAGTLGLIQAVDRFDPERGYAFSTYAVPLVLGEMRKLLRQKGAVRVSRRARDLVRRVREKQGEIAARRGEVPSIMEVAREIGIDPAEVVWAQEAVRSPVPVDDIAAGRWSEADHLETMSLHDAVQKLDPRLREVVTLRFFQDRTQQQTAEALGVSQAHVSRLEKEALSWLRRLLRSF